eukprot:1193351-Prorocentrum_minimum.AAC.4
MNDHVGEEKENSGLPKDAANAILTARLVGVGGWQKATDPKDVPTKFVSRLQRTVARVATQAKKSNKRRILNLPGVGLKFWRRDTEVGRDN